MPDDTGRYDNALVVVKRLIVRMMAGACSVLRDVAFARRRGGSRLVKGRAAKPSSRVRQGIEKLDRQPQPLTSKTSGRRFAGPQFL